jgi:hypothetical protein
MMKALLVFVAFLLRILPGIASQVAFDESCLGNEDAERFLYKAEIEIDVKGSCPDMNQLLSMIRVVYEAIGQSTEETAALTTEDIDILADKVTLDHAFCDEPIVDGDSKRRLSLLSNLMGKNHHPATTASEWLFRGGGEAVLCYPKVNVKEDDNYGNRLQEMENDIEQNKQEQRFLRRVLTVKQAGVAADMELEDDELQAKIENEQLDMSLEEAEVAWRLAKELTDLHKEHGPVLTKELKEKLLKDENEAKQALQQRKLEMNDRHGRWKRELRKPHEKQRKILDGEKQTFEEEEAKKMQDWDLRRALVQAEHAQNELMKDDGRLASEQLVIATEDFYRVVKQYEQTMHDEATQNLRDLWREHEGACFDEPPAVKNLVLKQVRSEGEAEPTDERCNS